MVMDTDKHGNTRRSVCVRLINSARVATVVILSAVLTSLAPPAFAQPGPGGFPTRTPRPTATAAATPTPVPGPVVVNVLPNNYAATTARDVAFAFRQSFFNKFYTDAVSLNGWSGPSGTTGFSQIDSNPNSAISKLIDFLVILRRNGSGLYDLLAERHDSGMLKIGQAFTSSGGNVQGAADFTMETQGVSRYLSQDRIVETDAAAGIDALAYLRVSWCDVAPDIAYAAFLKVGPQLASVGMIQRPFPCAIPAQTPTPTPAPTATPTPAVTPTPTATVTATPSQIPSLTPTVAPPGGFTLTITCSGCTPTTVSVPASGATITVSPK